MSDDIQILAARAPHSLLDIEEVDVELLKAGEGQDTCLGARVSRAGAVICGGVQLDGVGVARGSVVLVSVGLRVWLHPDFDDVRVGERLGCEFSTPLPLLNVLLGPWPPQLWEGGRGDQLSLPLRPPEIECYIVWISTSQPE